MCVVGALYVYIIEAEIGLCGYIMHGFPHIYRKGGESNWNIFPGPAL